MWQHSIYKPGQVVWDNVQKFNNSAGTSKRDNSATVKDTGWYQFGMYDNYGTGCVVNIFLEKDTVVREYIEETHDVRYLSNLQTRSKYKSLFRLYANGVSYIYFYSYDNDYHKNGTSRYADRVDFSVADPKQIVSNAMPVIFTDGTTSFRLTYLSKFEP